MFKVFDRADEQSDEVVVVHTKAVIALADHVAKPICLKVLSQDTVADMVVLDEVEAVLFRIDTFEHLERVGYIFDVRFQGSIGGRVERNRIHVSGAEYVFSDAYTTVNDAVSYTHLTLPTKA